MTLITEPGTYPNSIRTVAFAAHPSLGNTVIDAVMNNNGTPIAGRLRSLIATALGSEWTVMDWYPAEGEF